MEGIVENRIDSTSPNKNLLNNNKNFTEQTPPSQPPRSTLPASATAEADTSELYDDDNNLLNNKNNQTAIEAFSRLLFDQLNVQDVKCVLDSQQQTLKKLDVTNKNLLKTNQSSLNTLNTFGTRDYQSHIGLLNTMKQDLEFISKRIRIIKNKLQLKYPDEFSKAIDSLKPHLSSSNLEDELDETPKSPNELNDSTNKKMSTNNVTTPTSTNTTPTTTTTTTTKSSQLVSNDSIDELSRKERSKSNISNVSVSSSTSSTTSSTSVLAGFIQNARNRLSSSGKDLVNGIFNQTSSSPSPTNSQIGNPLVNNTFIEPPIE